MDERRPDAPAEQISAPRFNPASSALETVDRAQVELDVPKGFSVRERRDGTGYAFESRRTMRSFAVWLLQGASILSLIGSMCFAALRNGIDGDRTVSLMVMSLIIVVAVPWAYRLLRRAFESARIALSDAGVRVHGGLWTLTDAGVTSIPLAEIDGFTVQMKGVARARVMVRTQQGEAKLLRCNVLDPAHAIFVVTRLNRALSELRAVGSYRG
jgi:hypothetical protein